MATQPERASQHPTNMPSAAGPTAATSGPLRLFRGVGQGAGRARCATRPASCAARAARGAQLRGLLRTRCAARTGGPVVQAGTRPYSSTRCAAMRGPLARPALQARRRQGARARGAQRAACRARGAPGRGAQVGGRVPRLGRGGGGPCTRPHAHFHQNPVRSPRSDFFYQPSACPCAAVVRAARPARVFSLMGRASAVRCAG